MNFVKIKNITLNLILFAVFSLGNLIPVKTVHAQPLQDYVLVATQIAMTALTNLKSSTLDEESWAKKGDCRATQALADNSLKSLNELHTEIAINGVNAREGFIFAKFISAHSQARTILEKVNASGSEGAKVTAAEYEVILSVVGVGIASAFTSLADNINGALGGAAEKLGESHCADGIDNDGDGLVDCADVPCSGFEFCQIPPTETACNDEVDNDEDGAIDCHDSDCANDPVCAPSGEDCNNGVDDDGDGLVDCCDVMDCPVDGCNRICGGDIPN